MKKLALIIFALIPLAIYSCTDLSENPKGLLAPEDFFKTPEDVEAAVHGAYAEWCTAQTEKSFLLMLMLRGDMVDIGDQNTLADRIDVNDFSTDSYNSLVSDSWDRFYQSISAANTAIQGARQITANADVKSKLEGQARFIRAFTYFHLVRCFGPVPYLNKPIETTAALDTIQRMPVEQVYDSIIADLTYAKDKLPARNTPDVRNIGTMGSAATVLADVFLTLKRFEEAAAEARFVISNVTTFNYGLEKNYQDLFNGNIEQSGSLKEPIFTIDLKADLNDGSYNPNEGLINLTRIRDLAPRSLSVAVPALSVYKGWDERDYRKKVSFEDSAMINGVMTALIDAPIRVARPHIAKYFRYPGPQVGDDRSSDHHYSLYRYADVLLMAAEAIGESEGATQEAVGYLNQVRARARFNGTTVTSYPPDIVLGIGKDDFIEAVRDERRLEFAFEFGRWYDIKRWGILSEAFTRPESLEHHTVDVAKDYYFPLPQSEIDLTKYKQNAGY